MEEMYSILVPTEGLKDFTNGLSDVVDGFNNVLEAAGGLPTILTLISTILLTKF
jgi:hypothetical protein